MKDISSDAESRFHEMMMKKTGQERLKIGFLMTDIARKQVLLSIIKESPNADASEIRKQFFLRFYGKDFTPEEREKILAQI